MATSKKFIGHFFLKTLLILMIIFIATATVIGLVFSIYVEKNIEKHIDESLFTSFGTGASSRIYYYDFTDRTNRIGTLHEISSKELYGAYKCKSVKYEQIPEDLINAFISIEDKRFLKHSGVDWKRTLSAGANYFLKFSGSYGGSTITQQLIKNVTKNDDYSFQRKIQEIFWALDLEKKMDKKEILLMYLNIINLSQGCFGVGAASEYYFSKDVSDLSLAECACIAAITNSPSYYDPIKNPENNQKRRNIILNEMFTQGYIDIYEYEEAYATPIELKIKELPSDAKINSWYVDMVIEDVINDLISSKNYSRDMANLMVYMGGLKIYTAMDIQIQTILDEYYSNTNNFYNNSSETNPQSSTIIIDPKTGDILGVAGCIGIKEANRLQNFATQTLRPAGSVIKPLSVYAPALEKNLITWASVYDDVPVNFGKYNLDASKGRIVSPSPWPKNANNIYRGLTNVNYALTHSVNTVTVKILNELSLDSSFDFLYNDLNIYNIILSKNLENGKVITDKDYAALALGQFNYGVTLREITGAYSIFANKGIYNDYRSYIKVTDNTGNIVLSKPYKGKSVISEENSSIMTLMLENVVKSGTANDIKLKSMVNVAGKTGTTQNNYDKWFIGYTPHFICGTWLGYEYPKSLAGYSGNSCNKIWDDIMTIVHKNCVNVDTLKNFSIHENVIRAKYCADSGKLVTEACKNDLRGDRTEAGYFVKNTVPRDFCDVHVLVDYDVEYGCVASADCPYNSVEQVGMINVTRKFPCQIYVSDAQYVWRDIKYDILPETSPSLPFFSNLLKKDEFCGLSYTDIQKNCYCREHFDYYKWNEKRKNQKED